MKIPLHLNQNGAQSTRQAEAKVLEHDIRAAREGDWNAKNSLVRTFTPLLTARAEKRSSDPAKINHYMEAGKKGLLTAAKRYKKGADPQRFRIFALDYIEQSMDRADGGGGFLAKLFGRA